LSALLEEAAVGLTESKIKDLHDKKFDKLYEKHQQEWDDMTTNAFNAARDHICGGKQPRPDDVLKMLLPMLEPNETLRKHQETVHARYVRFREAFGEYMIDKFLAP
jgi:hypothetical protein